MSNFLQGPLLILLLYIFIGIAIGTVLDPSALADGLIRAHAQRGTSPTAVMFLMMVLIILALWSDLIAALFRGRR